MVLKQSAAASAASPRDTKTPAAPGSLGDVAVLKWHAHTCAHTGTTAGTPGLLKLMPVWKETCDNNTFNLSD